jgi:integrase
MAGRLHKLKDLHLRAWIKAGAPVAKSDGGGLTFTLSAAGNAVFVLRYRLQGKQYEITLGRYPDLPLEEARAKASELRRRVAEGVNVAREKQRKKRMAARASTFGELAEDYMARVAVSLKASTRGEYRRHLDGDILPRLGSLPLEALGPSDVIQAVEAIAKRSHSVAERAYIQISTICSHGVAKHLLAAHPCTHLKISSIIGTRATRERIKLTRAELVSFLCALPQLGRSNELALKVIMATGVRKSELLGARWEHVDLGAAVWTVPAGTAKTDGGRSGKDFLIPLAPSVVEWFHELKSLAGASVWALPTRKRSGPPQDKPIGMSTLNAALARLDGEWRNFAPHDLRSTARSYLSELGVPVIVAERCLNHSVGGLVSIYDQHDYLEERRRALELWANFINQAEQGHGWNVIPIQKAAR